MDTDVRKVTVAVRALAIVYVEVHPGDLPEAAVEAQAQRSAREQVDGLRGVTLDFDFAPAGPVGTLEVSEVIAPIRVEL